MKGFIKKILVAVIGFSLIAGIVFQNDFTTFAAEIEGNADVEENGMQNEADTNKGDGDLFDQPDADENSDTGETQQGIEDESEDSDSNMEENKPDSESGTQEDLKENSWRYKDGNPIETNLFRSRAATYPNAWQKVNGVYMNSNGEAIEGAVKKGIDVSEHQGKIDWNKVKADGIDFAIIRCGYGDNYTSQDDKQWQYNVSECERLGIPYGVYIYSYATNTTMAKSEAQHVLRLISGHKLSYPVYFDMEDNSTVKVSSEMKGQIAKTFCDTISASGFKVGIYANLNWWTSYLTSSVFNTNSWSKWVAQYNATCDYSGDYDIWQSTDKGSVNGISGNVDLNFLMDGTIDNNSSNNNGNNGGGNNTKEEIISFASYMETYGWQETVHNGEDAGLPGYSKNLMGFKINIGKGYNDLGVKYSAHVSGIGWLDYASNGALAGSTNNKGIEAIKIELTGNEAAKYDIYYRVHIKNNGWMGWATNGQSAGTEGYSRRVESIQIKIVSKGSAAPGSTNGAFLKKGIKLEYQSYIQGRGWQGSKSDGESSGTSGEHVAIEGIKVKVEDSEYNGNIVYNTYMQNIGWQSEQSNNTVSGLPGKGLRMEALKINLTGDLAKNYDVYYRTHVQNYGWLGWAKNGQQAGTADYSLRIEAFEIKLVKKGGTAPGNTENAFRHPLVKYQTHVQFAGWQGYVKDGAVSGVTGESRRLEAINISLLQQEYSGNIEYKTHVQFAGWQGWKKNGENSGTTGQSRRLEAIQIKLTGEMAKHYDVYYRTHVQNIGWLDWAKNGQNAGTSGMSKRLEAIQIKLVPKGESAPGSTIRAFIEK